MSSTVDVICKNPTCFPSPLGVAGSPETMPMVFGFIGPFYKLVFNGKILSSFIGKKVKFYVILYAKKSLPGWILEHSRVAEGLNN